MLDVLEPLVPDPILGLISAFNQDTNPNKVDLGVGVYKDEAGHTPVLESVRRAEEQLLSTQNSKAYLGPAGDSEFNRLFQLLLLGPAHSVIAASRAATVQTPGGCGALRLGAELIHRARPDATIWVSNPTWANHIPLLGSVGLKITEYPYYDYANKGISFDDMLGALRGATPGDVVLLHASCHNPCGGDLNLEQWRALADLMAERQLVPFIDSAYQGFGEGLDEDVAGLRLVAEAVPELLIAGSCSKNFGLYRERTGALTVVANNAAQAAVVHSQLCHVARGMWSMPPDHGAAVVAGILASTELRPLWEQEVADMRGRINGLRQQLVAGLDNVGAGDFSFIAREHGMFSFLGINADQVHRLADEYSIYMVDSSRINIAGLNTSNMGYVAEAIATVMAQPG